MAQIESNPNRRSEFNERKKKKERDGIVRREFQITDRKRGKSKQREMKAPSSPFDSFRRALQGETPFRAPLAAAADAAAAATDFCNNPRRITDL